MMDLKTQLLADLYASVESKLKVGITTSGTNKIRLTEISSIKPKPVRLTDGGIFFHKLKEFFSMLSQMQPIFTHLPSSKLFLE